MKTTGGGMPLSNRIRVNIGDKRLSQNFLKYFLVTTSVLSKHEKAQNSEFSV